MEVVEGKTQGHLGLTLLLLFNLKHTRKELPLETAHIHMTRDMTTTQVHINIYKAWHMTTKSYITYTFTITSPQ